MMSKTKTHIVTAKFAAQHSPAVHAFLKNRRIFFTQFRCRPSKFNVERPDPFVQMRQNSAYA